jgi:hypothetical protein
MNFSFNRPEYRTQGFPGWCCSYMTFRNEKKRRPLFVYGWATGGVVTVTFDNKSGLLEDFKVASVGTGTVDVSNYACTRAEDWVDYTCAEWVNQEPMPTVQVSVKAIRGWKEQNQIIKAFLNPDRGALKKRDLETFRPEYGAQVDMVLSAAGRTLAVTNLPCKFTFGDHEKYWNVKFTLRFNFQGADLGLTGDDAGEIAAKFVSESFSALPKEYKPPDLKKTPLKAAVLEDIGINE